MLISGMVEVFDLRVLAQGTAEEVEGCYIGDLLSRVISRSTAGGLWITIMNNLNVPAVALLAEVPCVLLAEGVAPMEGVVEKCVEEGIWLLQSDDSAYELASKLSTTGL